MTSGEQAATLRPVFNAHGTKAAWIELEQDGHESDRYVLSLAIPPPLLLSILNSGRIVIYDLEKNVRFTLTQKWDRTATDIAVRRL